MDLKEVSLRPPRSEDRLALIEGRDSDSRRWLGEGSAEPSPTACILLGDVVIGWVDSDTDREWLDESQVNVGYCVFPDYRGRGVATAALRLFLRQLAVETNYATATLLIEGDNDKSLAVAERSGFRLHGEIGTSRYFEYKLRQEPIVEATPGEPVES